jgi:hypothetical protein
MTMYFRTADSLGEAAPQLQVPAYTPPYPNIQSKMPAIYPLAVAARNALDKLAWFKSVYVPLMRATGSAHLALNAADEIVVLPEEVTTTALLGDKLVKDVLKRSGKALFKELAGANFARVLGVVDLLLKLHTALTMDDARRLVSEQRHSRRDEAYRYKLRFFIGLYIGQVAPQADRVRLAWRIEQAFFEYQKAETEVSKYDDIEANLAQGLRPNQRRAPVMRPYP